MCIGEIKNGKKVRIIHHNKYFIAWLITTYENIKIEKTSKGDSYIIYINKMFYETCKKEYKVYKNKNKQIQKMFKLL